MPGKTRVLAVLACVLISSLIFTMITYKNNGKNSTKHEWMNSSGHRIHTRHTRHGNHVMVIRRGNYVKTMGPDGIKIYRNGRLVKTMGSDGIKKYRNDRLVMHMGSRGIIYY